MSYFVEVYDFSSEKRSKSRKHINYEIIPELAEIAKSIAESEGLSVRITAHCVVFGPFSEFESALEFAERFRCYNIMRVF